MPSTIVIGAGVMGTTIAYRLAARGQEVCVLDAGAIGAGTSAASFAMHIATRKTPRAHFDLAVQGGVRHRDLERELAIEGGSPRAWVHPAPVYEWPVDEHDGALIAARIDRLREWGYAAEWTTRDEVLAHAPALVIPAEVRAVARYPREYWYDTDLMVANLAAAAKMRGALFSEGQTVESIDAEPGGVAVRTSGGGIHRAETVVIAAGPATRDVAGLAGHLVPVERVPGIVVTTDPVAPGTIEAIVMNPDINVRPAPGGRLALQSYTAESDLGEDDHVGVGAPVVDRIRRFAVDLLPTLAHVRFATARLGVRPLPVDGLPIVGWLDEPRIYVAAAHSAVNLAPVLSEMVAEEVLGGSHPGLAPFRPGRRGLTAPGDDTLDESTREMRRMYAERRQATVRPIRP